MSKKMKFGILMNFTSPWARSIVNCLNQQDCLLHLIGFKPSSSIGNYLNPNNDLQKSEINNFLSKFENISFLKKVCNNNFDYLFNAPRLRDISIKNNFDLLLCLYGGGFSTMAYLSCFRPYSVFLVGSDILLASNKLKFLNKISLNSSILNFANGENLTKRALTQAPDAKIKNLLQGIDLDQFKFKPNNNSKIIVSNRGFLPVYNNQLILEALKIDCDILESIKVHFLASGPLFEELETYAKSNIPTKLQSKIVFFNGVPHEKMPQYLSEARIFISCSKSDGTATSLLEAMACGVFPIVSNIPANTEWIVNEENGLVIDLNDPQALAIAIRRAIEDETLFDKTVKFNRKLVEEKASIDKNMKILIKTLKDKLCL